MARRKAGPPVARRRHLQRVQADATRRVHVSDGTPGSRRSPAAARTGTWRDVPDVPDV